MERGPLRRMKIREAETTESNTHTQCDLAGVSRLGVLHGAWCEAVVNEYSSDCWRGTACADSSFRGGIPRASLIGNSGQGGEAVSSQLISAKVGEGWMQRQKPTARN